MNRADHVEYLVIRAREEESLEPPPADATALLAQLISRLGRAFSGVDHLFDDNARRTNTARATFEEQVRKLAAEVAGEAERIDAALAPGIESLGRDGMWEEITRQALVEQFEETLLIGPVINEALRRFSSFAIHHAADVRSETVAYRDQLISLAAQLVDMAARISPPQGNE